MAYDIEAALHVLQKGGERVTSKFGTRTIYIGGAWNTNFHSGIDLVQRATGTDYIIAAAPGIVTATRNTISGYSETYASGNYVCLEHGGGYATEYKHMAKGSVCVAAGDTVAKGQALGYMGTTGWSTGNHLHFGIRVDGTAVDPEPYLLGHVNIPEYKGGNTVMAQQQLILTRAPLYAASTSQKAAGTVTGTYYLWSPSPVNGRYRITNSTANIGKTGQVTGWIDALYVMAAQPPAPAEEEPAFDVSEDNTALQLAACRDALDRIRQIVNDIA